MIANDPKVMIGLGDLVMASAQQVLKAVGKKPGDVAKIIILDEPTNNLGVEETHGVLRFIKEVRAAGHSLIFITHNIHHVFEVCDRAVIMRQGEVIADVNMHETDVLAVEGIITGADLTQFTKGHVHA